MPTYRIYVEKKPRFSIEAKNLFSKLKTNLGLNGIEGLRIIYRYDVSNIEIKDFYKATQHIFSDSMIDIVYDKMPEFDYNEKIFACDLLDSKFDVDAFGVKNALCVLLGKDDFSVKFAKIYAVKGLVTSDDLNRIKSFVINPLYAKETYLTANSDDFDDLAWPFFTSPDTVIENFTEMSSVELTSVIITHKLEISEDKLQKIQEFYRNVAKRNPTAIELKIINKYIAYSTEDSVFNYTLSDFSIENPVELSAHKRFSEILNFDKARPLSFTVSDATDAIKTQDTKYYVASDMHDNFANIDSTASAEDSISNALHTALKKRIMPCSSMHLSATVSPFSNSSFNFNPQIENDVAEYTNRLGIPVGYARDIYRQEFSSRPLNIHAFFGKRQSKSEYSFSDGDKIYILGDAVSSKSPYVYSHFENSILNFVTDKKVQSLSKFVFSGNLFKEIFDFPYGIALNIDNTVIPEYFDFSVFDDVFLSRTAIVVERQLDEDFKSIADDFGIPIIEAGTIINDNSIVVQSSDKVISDLPKDFIKSLFNSKSVKVSIKSKAESIPEIPNLKSNWIKSIAEANCLAQKGINETFDSSVGNAVQSGGVLYDLADFSTVCKDDENLFAFASSFDCGTDNMYSKAILAVCESICRVAAKGVNPNECEISVDIGILGGTFESKVASSFYSAILGLFDMQNELGFKISNINKFVTHNSDYNAAVCAYSTGEIKYKTSYELKNPGDKIVLVAPSYDANSIPDLQSLKKALNYTWSLISSGKARAVYPLGENGVSEAIAKMCFVSKLGFNFTTEINRKHLFGNCKGGFLVELENNVPTEYRVVGRVEDIYKINCPTFSLDLNELETVWISRLNSFYPSTTNFSIVPINKFKFDAESHIKPKEKSDVVKIVIPVFVGTVGHKDLKAAFAKAGGQVEFVYISLNSPDSVEKSTEKFSKALKDAHILAIPSGFSGLCESSGQGELISIFLEKPICKSAIEDLITERFGLILGIGNGFQALLKTGLLPFGEFRSKSKTRPTFSQNVIGRHQARVVSTRICSNRSPWLSSYKVDDIVSVPISYSYGRFIADVDLLGTLDENGQIASQYVDSDGTPSTNIRYNPSNSVCAIEAITSPDGRILGKMGHSERTDSKIFESAINFFK